MRSDHISIKRQRSAAGGGEERAQALTERGEGPKNSGVHWRSDEFTRLSCGRLPGPALPPATLTCGPLNPPCLGPLPSGPLHICFLLFHSSDSPSPLHQTPHRRFCLLFAGAWPLGGTYPRGPPTSHTLPSSSVSGFGESQGIVVSQLQRGGRTPPGHCKPTCDQSWWRPGSFPRHLFVIPQFLVTCVGHCSPGGLKPWGRDIPEKKGSQDEGPSGKPETGPGRHGPPCQP